MLEYRNRLVDGMEFLSLCIAKFRFDPTICVGDVHSSGFMEQFTRFVCAMCPSKENEVYLAFYLFLYREQYNGGEAKRNGKVEIGAKP